jgi:uncharacterized protein
MWPECSLHPLLDGGVVPTRRARLSWLQLLVKIDPAMTEALNADAVLEAFGNINGRLPRAAMEQAIARWPEISPALLVSLNDAANGAAISERTDNILSISIYLMAQMRETRAYRPLCTLIAAGDRAEELLGDGVTEELRFILARVYDGDPAPLRALIEDRKADEFVRDAGLYAMAWLTAEGRIDREATADYLRDLHARLRPQAECYVWVGWQRAIANLGLADLAPLAEDAFRHGWISDTVLSPRHFREDLSRAMQATDPLDAFPPNERDDGSLDDAAQMLAKWPMFQPQKPVRKLALPTPVSTVRNPHRNVGRNDPCPCGSGKKFKKCCLEMAGAR